MIVYLDIETAPTSIPDEQLELELRARVPSNYRDRAKIAAHMDEHRETHVARTALGSMRGSICAIGWAFDHGPVFVVAGPEERGLLEQLEASLVEESSGLDITLCGHNLAGFDLPWLRRHAARHRMSTLLGLLPGGLRERRDDRIFDTMRIWQGTERGNGHYSLDDIARFLGLSPGTTHGSEIPGMVARSEWDRIRQHCADDVLLTRQVFDRICP